MRRALVAVLTLAACRPAEKAGEPASSSSATAATVAVSPSVNPAAPAPDEASAPKPSPADPGAPVDKAASLDRYPMTGFRPLVPGCAPRMSLSSAHKTPAPTWTFVRATLAAHRELKVDGAAPDSVAFTTYETLDHQSVVLTATCDRIATCNRLAAVLHTMVPTSRPQPMCGDGLGAGVTVLPVHLDVRLPVASDPPVEKCARIGVCMRAADPTSASDPGIECQKAPSHWKLGCALKATCDEVNACLK